MTVFLHARIHRARWRALIAAEPVLIACPTCGTAYAADLEPEEEPVELEADEWAALVRLDAECPDHPHRFSVND